MPKTTTAKPRKTAKKSPVKNGKTKSKKKFKTIDLSPPIQIESASVELTTAERHKRHQDMLASHEEMKHRRKQRHNARRYQMRVIPLYLLS